MRVSLLVSVFFVGLFDYCSLVLLKFSIGCFPNFITMSYERNNNRVSLRRQRCLTLQRIPMVILYVTLISSFMFRYGDYTPKSDIGKLAVAAYAIAVVNVIAGLLKPGRTYLEDLCRVPSYKANKKRTLSSVDDALAKLASAKKMT
jgi:hypothetical protein